MDRQVCARLPGTGGFSVGVGRGFFPAHPFWRDRQRRATIDLIILPRATAT